MWDISHLGRQGYDPDQLTTVFLRAGHKSSGEPVHEDVPAVQVAAATWRLLVTPALVEELAAGDAIRVFEDGGFGLASRGGSVAVKVWTRADEAALRELVAQAEEHGAWLDGYTPGSLVVLTFPAAVGFAGVESVLNRFTATQGESWHYDNV